MKKGNIPSVLMIGPSLASRGGMATVESQLMGHLPSEDIDVEFLTTYDDVSQLRKGLIALKAYGHYCKILGKFDIVHVHMASRASYSRKSLFIRRAFEMGKKVIIHVHGSEFGVWFDNELDESGRNDVRGLFENADVVVVLSEEWLEWFDSRGFSMDDYVVMHNAVSLPEEPCFPCSHRDVLFLGRLDARKSPDVLLRASKKMLTEHPETKLIFGGDGYPERYEALARELDIAEHCEFLGWITGEEKEALFRRAGVYCLPSKNEGMPMSVLEAMAHGLPVVATPVGGVPQVIANGIDGYIVPIGDVESLSRVLCDLADDSAKRGSMGAEARNKIADSFNLDDNVKVLAAMYRKLME